MLKEQWKERKGLIGDVNIIVLFNTAVSNTQPSHGETFPDVLLMVLILHITSNTISVVRWSMLLIVRGRYSGRAGGKKIQKKSYPRTRGQTHEPIHPATLYNNSSTAVQQYNSTAAVNTRNYARAEPV